MFWPIYILHTTKNPILFPIGIYWGYKKPYDSKIFMKYFVKEAQDLILNGIIKIVEVYDDINNEIVNVKKNIIFDVFCCDISAR